jgi:HK97 family phage portal protein
MDTPIQSGVIARVAGVIRDKLNLWFPPLEPLPQVAPKGTPTRRFDYMVGENIQIQPHLDCFMQLRALADGYDLLRIVIETFKDHLVKVPWIIRPIGNREKGTGNRKKTDDLRIQKLTELFSFPDGEQPWSAWLRALLEDALVIDAPTIEPITTRGGELVRLDLIDGATITPKIAYDGRLPKPPEVAYQQIVKGAPTVEFTADELIYYPRNRRTHKIYGYSPVEQIVVMANLALRREIWLLNFFTEGSIPEAYLGVPDTWTPDQIKQAQDAFDSYLAGNLRNRRKVIFGPDGKLQLLKADAIGGDAVLDELIVRMICFAFNVSPQALVTMMNRATAETAKAQAAEEGLIPWMMYIQDLMNLILRKYCRVTDLEFAWQDEKEEDPTAQANNIKTLTSIGVMTVNEGRDRLGLDPVDGGDVALIYTAQGATPLAEIGSQRSALSDQPEGTGNREQGTEGVTAPQTVAPVSGPAGPASTPEERQANPRPHAASQPAEEGARATKVAKAGDPAAGSYFVTANDVQREAEDRINLLLQISLALLAENLGLWYAALAGDPNPGPVPAADDLWPMLLGSDGEAKWDDLEAKIAGELQVGFSEAMRGELNALQVDDVALLGQVDSLAATWAATRAPQLLAQVSDTTSEGLHDLIQKALDEHQTPEQFENTVRNSWLFSTRRAEIIAATEMTASHMQGLLQAWKSSALVKGCRWVTDNDPCKTCMDNAQAGVVKLGRAFPSGHNAPPAHPNCRCSLSPVLAGRAKSEKGGSAGL